ncbi:hypothetical protein Bca52824_077569 [Brassica carinata]|uniref:BHLH domain-containing protein n=1 Tax=Brassica carinata TaxID=52824 RepID=A0A8X7PV71_BRACI|nr:hypothetical protein Bca52824_077569 [Brassica carinata]
MHAFSPPLFPDSGWAPMGEYESYKLVGDNHYNDTFFDFPVPETYGVVHHQTSLGVPVSSEGNGINNNPVEIKKLNHNAKERNRRQKANLLFSSLRSCLPRSYQSKKLSIPETVLRSLQYIPELQEEVKKLTQKKEDLLVRVSDQKERYLTPQAKVAASYFSTVFATKSRDNEVTVQISSSKIHNFSIHNVLSGLEEDGFVLVNISSSRSSRGERLFYTLHLQVDKTDSYKLICEDLRQRVLYLYEGCVNSFK